ncbi:glucan endo-1,3-beta-glucosidase 8 [Selaginella moellendorffii]|nr:glucan endo-1,3-beta-glucosidase 8 [Selaginella moellendorffii]|eukprot:XP_002970359.2 glucan endo-1,3-beta-glucosidase 8 [Selaginella moellendorffii]
MGSIALPSRRWILIALVAAAVALAAMTGVDSVGVNWGTVTSHRLPDKMIVKLLQESRISKVKLFDADPSVIRAFAGTDLELMVAVPNDLLEDMAFSEKAARRFVRRNITKFLSHQDGVNIRYIAVGNEPFLKAYNGSYEDVTIPAIRNMQQAIEQAGIQHKVTLVVPLNADILTNSGNSGKPSQGAIRPDIRRLMRTILEFLDKHKAPFVINMYPFLSLQQDSHFPSDFAFFDGSAHVLSDGRNFYSNVFDASYDLLVSALAREGFPDMEIVVGEVGWPTDGDIYANIPNAQRFNQQLIRHVTSNRGTPLRPGIPIEIYIFGLVDEDRKSVLPGNFERHWGLYRYDGKPKYSLDVSGRGGNGLSSPINLMSVSGVTYLPSRWCVLNPEVDDLSKLPATISYACSYADCSTLAYGGSCNHIGQTGNASYAFNSFYQMNNQRTESCHFGGLGMITETDPSSGNCQFRVEITPWSAASTVWRGGAAVLVVSLLVALS